MERPLLPVYAANGGFPEPPRGGRIRVVAARHPACGASTRVRLPSTVSARAVHRLHCAGCDHDFNVLAVTEIGLEDPRLAPAPEPPPIVARRPAKPSKPARPARAPSPDASSTRALRRRLDAAPVAERRRRRRGPHLRRPRITLPSRPRPRLERGLRSAAPATPARTRTRTRPHGRPRLDPQSLSWKVLSVPLAALLVVAGLLALRGGGDAPTAPAEAARHQDGRQAADARAGKDESSKGDGESAGGGDGKVSKNAHLVAGVTYSFALPAGWERVDPPDGATFAAEASDGGADATLWITEDPKLEFPTFVSQSLAQLEALAGSAQVVERVPAPSAEDTIVRLAADAPAGEPSYEVTLRVGGPYRYYLATSVDPEASKKAGEGADLITGSFTPDAEG